MAPETAVGEDMDARSDILSRASCYKNRPQGALLSRKKTTAAMPKPELFPGRRMREITAHQTANTGFVYRTA